MQSNHCPLYQTITSEIVSKSDWETFIIKLQTKSLKDNLKIIQKDIKKYNMEAKIYMNEFIQYLIKNKDYALKDKWIALFKFISHNEMVKTRYLVHYFISSLIVLYKLL